MTQSLSAEEQACLLFLTRHPDADPALRYDRAVLDSLASRGFIERVAAHAYPGLPARADYRLTPKGRAALDPD